MTDEELAAAATRGDERAFAELVQRLSPRVYRVAWSVLRDDHDAEDAVQDTFLAVHRNLPRFAGDARISTWVHRIAVNAALMKLRTRRRRPESPLDTDAMLQVAAPSQAGQRLGAERLEAVELAARIGAAVDELEEKYRVVFLLRDVEELSIQDTADVLELSVPAVKTRLHRARLYLRAALERYVKE